MLESADVATRSASLLRGAENRAPYQPQGALGPVSVTEMGVTDPTTLAW